VRSGKRRSDAMLTRWNWNWDERSRKVVAWGDKESILNFNCVRVGLIVI